MPRSTDPTCATSAINWSSCGDSDEFMKRFNRYYLLPALALLLLGAVLGVQLDSYLSDGDTIQQLKKLERAFVIINRQYVDSVASKDVAEEGIRGMLDELDPHSSYIRPEDVRQVRESYQGSFGGIGIVFEVVRDTARVISPVADGPSERAGVMGGDRIIQIKDSTAVGLSSRGIQKRLKGPIGSDVQMTVYRPSLDKEYTYTLTRDEIPLYSINTSYMVDNQTGYIEIDRFAMTTYDEFKEEMSSLKDQGMQRLVIDLRDNPGGVMKSAIEIADELLGSGMTILQTRGRQSGMNNQYRASNGGTFEEPPVMVLVNGNSASASEIVSGALQDHDRALIVGQRTFGKALVQRQFELTDGSLLQMTVGRYYTPVGRLIQSPYENSDREDYYSDKFATIRDATFNLSEYRDSIPDSLSYQTDHGRTVFGGGGILPDYVVQPDTTSLTRFIAETQLDFAFVVDWFPRHEQALRSTWADNQEAFMNTYTPDPAVVDSFWTFAEEKGLELTTSAEGSPSEGRFSTQKANAAEAFVQTRIKGFLARQLYGSSAMRPILNEVDPVFQEAMTLWDDAAQLSSYHASTEPTTTEQDAASVGDGD